MAFCAAFAVELLAQQTPFRSKVDTVLIDVLVTERNAPLPGLDPHDFVVRDNGVLQSVTSVLAGSSGLGIVLLLDTSGSLSLQDVDHLRKAAAQVATSIGAEDQLRLVTFSDSAKLYGVVNATTLTPIFRNVRSEGDTALRDGLIAGLELNAHAEMRRPVLIVFSDGADTASWFGTQDVEREARQSWTSVFAVTPRSGAFTMLRSLTELTGGEVLVLDEGLSSLPVLFSRILDKLRQRYVVAFDPSSNSPGWHELDVRVRRSNVHVVARKGYVH